MVQVSSIHGDITTMHIDAVVNATDTSFSGGGGIDLSIHIAAGSKLAIACDKLKGIKTGEAKITDGYNLPARFVIHTVGPIYKDGNHNEAKQLESAYIQSLKLADKYNIKTIAFPSISSGVYGYPKLEAAKVAKHAIDEYLKTSPSTSLKEIYMVAHSEEGFKILHSIFE